MGRQRMFVTRPPFVVDPRSVNHNSGRQVDWSVVPDTFRQGTASVTVATAGATTGATQIPVLALPVNIPTGAALYFGSTAKYALLTAAATTGATQLSVQAIPQNLASGNTAIVAGTAAKTLPAGKAMVELANGKIAPRSDRPGSEACAGFLEANAIEGDVSAAKTGYGLIIGGALYENLLPDATGGTTGALPDAYKTELSNATTPKSTGFAFEQYADTRS